MRYLIYYSQWLRRSFFFDQNGQAEMFCISLVPLPKRHISAGPALKYFCMIHRGGRVQSIVSIHCILCIQAMVYSLYRLHSKETMCSVQYLYIALHRSLKRLCTIDYIHKMKCMVSWLLRLCTQLNTIDYIHKMQCLGLHTQNAIVNIAFSLSIAIQRD